MKTVENMMTEYTKVVYNACYGGFGLSGKAIEMYLTLKGFAFTIDKPSYGYNTYTVEGWEDFTPYKIDRTDPVLALVVETLGGKANGRCAELRIKKLRKGILYRITEYDGYERIETNDNVDWKVA